jgi:CHRD domain
MIPLMRPTPVVVLLAILALAGCAQRPAVRTFHVDLSASHEVPPADSNGTGQADLTLDPATRQLAWKITYAALTSEVTAAHMHGPARPGNTAGVLLDLAPGGVRNPIEGSATLSEADIDYLMLARCYINLHTTQYKGGEIRGQIVP